MAKKNGVQGAQLPPAGEAGGLEIGAAFDVKDAQELSAKGREIILRAAAMIAEADKIAADKTVADKLAADQHAQSKAGRDERRAKIGA